MKKIEIDQMMNVQGGIDYWTIDGISCALALSGAYFGGFPVVVTGLIFGPTCAGMAIAGAVG